MENSKVVLVLSPTPVLCANCSGEECPSKDADRPRQEEEPGEDGAGVAALSGDKMVGEVPAEERIMSERNLRKL